MQAKLLAQRLSDVQFDEIICSDLNRAVKTSEYILAFHKETKVTYEKRIRERNVGAM